MFKSLKVSLNILLLSYCFTCQMGEAKWQKLSEQERQRHLMEMRLKERQLRREGRWEELEQLLGECALSWADVIILNIEQMHFFYAKFCEFFGKEESMPRC